MIVSEQYASDEAIRVRKRVLVVCPFSIYPLYSGGALRSYHLLRELARNFDTHAIVTDHAEEICYRISNELGGVNCGLTIEAVEAAGGNRTPWQRLRDRLRTAWMHRSLRVPSNSVVLAIDRVIGRKLSRLRFDAVVLTNLETSVLGRCIVAKQANAWTVVDMQNIEHILLGRTLEANGERPESNGVWRRLKLEEGRIHRYTKSVFACSEDDKRVLQIMNHGKISGATIPNGVACDKICFDTSPQKCHSKRVLFCGSLAYPPNIDGIRWFVQEVWTHVTQSEPNATLHVVGRGAGESLRRDLEGVPSVVFVGEVDDLTPHYRSAGVCVVPLHSGSGTRLKVLEAAAYGNPIVSTSIGCEGIDVVDGSHLLIGNDAASFAQSICLLLKNAERFDSLRHSARAFVESNYDWRVIGHRMRLQLEAWCNV